MSDNGRRENGDDGGQQPSGRVLVVDDQDPNRLLLRDLLEVEGHEVTEAADGATALRLVAEGAPDLILLDVNMPGMDGFEVCRRLKADPKTVSIPVLLVTALSHREQRITGIASGANDYITKPIDGAELTLRVRNAIRMHRLHAEVQSQYTQLQRLEQLRDNLVHMIVHDLRAPLTGILLYMDMLRQDAGDSLDPELAGYLDEASRSARWIADMVGDLLDMSRLESGMMPLNRTEVDLCALAAEAMKSVSGAGRGAPVMCEAPPQPITALCDRQVILRVIANFVGNASKFTPREGQIRVQVSMDESGPRVAVSDTGPGIPAQALDTLFDKFSQVEAAQQQSQRSSGLGLTFCKLAVEAHGGRVGVESEVGKGSVFWFVLPRPA